MKINIAFLFIFYFCYGQNKTVDGIVAIVEDNIILNSDLSSNDQYNGCTKQIKLK